MTTAAVVKEALADCGRNKSPSLGSFPEELYYSKPDLFGHLLACTIILCEGNHLQIVGEVIKEYKAVTEAKINRKISVGWQIGT